MVLADYLGFMRAGIINGGRCPVAIEIIDCDGSRRRWIVINEAELLSQMCFNEILPSRSWADPFSFFFESSSKTAASIKRRMPVILYRVPAPGGLFSTINLLLLGPFDRSCPQNIIKRRLKERMQAHRDCYN